MCLKLLQNYLLRLLSRLRRRIFFLRHFQRCFPAFFQTRELLFILLGWSHSPTVFKMRPTVCQQINFHFPLFFFASLMRLPSSLLSSVLKIIRTFLRLMLKLHLIHFFVLNCKSIPLTNLHFGQQIIPNIL